MISTNGMYNSQISRKMTKKDFRLVQNVKMGEQDNSKIRRLRNSPVVAAENFRRDENLTPVQSLAMFKDMVEHFKLAHEVVDVVDRAKKKIYVILSGYNVYKPEESYAQVLFF